MCRMSAHFGWRKYCITSQMYKLLTVDNMTWELQICNMLLKKYSLTFSLFALVFDQLAQMIFAGKVPTWFASLPLWTTKVVRIAYDMRLGRLSCVRTADQGRANSALQVIRCHVQHWWSNPALLSSCLSPTSAWNRTPWSMNCNHLRRPRRSQLAFSLGEN